MAIDDMILPVGIERAIRDSLALNDNIVISRNSRLLGLDKSFDSLDLIQILSGVNVNPQNYCHGESLNKELLRYVVEQEGTELSAVDRTRLYNDNMCLATIDVIPYITAGHIARIVEYDTLIVNH